MPPSAPQEIQDFYNKALFYAAAAHNGQFYSTNLPYVIHVCMVANEVIMADKNVPVMNLKDAVQIALLHDVLEDTPVTKEELSRHFEPQVVHGVDLLTKRKGQPFHDYLQRIKEGPKDIAVIKMCDRIINLQKPPAAWPSSKIADYSDESEMILEMLGDGHVYAANRLKSKIEEYQQYISC